MLLLIILVIFVRRSRKRAAEAKTQDDVTIEASQMTGPAAILAATYTPETGHSRVYSIGPDTGGFSAVPMTPAPAVQSSRPTPAPPTAAQPIPSLHVQTPDFSNVPRSSSFNRFPAAPAGQPPKTAPAHKGNFDPYPFTGHGSTTSRPPASPVSDALSVVRRYTYLRRSRLLLNLPDLRSCRAEGSLAPCWLAV